jgi:hypothetical protein
MNREHKNTENDIDLNSIMQETNLLCGKILFLFNFNIDG